MIAEEDRRLASFHSNGRVKENLLHNSVLVHSVVKACRTSLFFVTLLIV